MSDIDPMSDDGREFNENDMDDTGNDNYNDEYNQSPYDQAYTGPQENEDYDDNEDIDDDTQKGKSHGNTIFNEDDDDEKGDDLQEVEDSEDSNASSSLQLSDSEPENDYEASGETSAETKYITKPEEIKMIYLRSFLNKIDKYFQDKDAESRQLQEEVRNCKEKIKNLEKIRDETYEKIQEAQEANNITILNRLASEHTNQCREIELETEVLEKLKETLEKVDYDRNKALLEKTKYALTNHELIQKEQLLARQKNVRGKLRQEDEETKVLLVKKKLEKQKKAESDKIKLQDIKHRHAMEEAKKARQVASEYLQKTLREMKEKKDIQELKSQGEMEKKRKSLLQLKNTLDHNKEMLNAKISKNRFDEKKKNEEIEKEKKQILARGENPDFYIPRRQKMEDFLKTKEKFMTQQKQNTQEIVKKIIAENENLDKKKKLYPELFQPYKGVPPEKPAAEDDYRKSLKALRTIVSRIGYNDEEFKKFHEEEFGDTQRQKELEKVETHSLFDSTTIASKDDDDSDYDELNKEDDILVKPEFEGLWNKKLEKYDAEDLYNRKKKFPVCFKTKMEQDIYLQTLDKLKKSAVKEQVVSGKKFKGVAFKSQPKIVHFKDFDVGTTYKMKVILTNISYTINTCKFMGLTERLKDFITIDFQPPGQLSAGLACEFNVTFEPKINEDLEGEVQFLASNGPFSIPISCTIKKCDLSVNNHSINFGTTVIGEVVNKKIQLSNKGALGTKFYVINTKYKSTQNQQLKMLTSESISTFQGIHHSSAIDVTNYDTNRLAHNLDELRTNISYLDGHQDENPRIDEILIGSVKDGFLAPFSNIELEFNFSPLFPGKFQENFVIVFEDKDSKEINLHAKGNAIDVPIWIDKTNIDLKICMYDRLYQEVIHVHNRASAALRITFEIPNELKNHMEILPKTAFIQAKADFSAQLKFIARSTLQEDAMSYFDSATGVLEVPLQVRVADQTKVVNYSLHAVVTTSDLKFDTTEIDFGYCTIFETSRATIKLTNKSILCQPFGFINLPEAVSVQPNDGFGTLLPNETIEIDVNFSPKHAKEYKFSVTCKSLVNRDFVINCKGIGVFPPLKLSSQRVHFKATALNDTSYAHLYVCNEHLDYDEHRHAVPRIGSGEIAKVGSTAFEFDLPENCPFNISPAVGIVNPGEKMKITLKYTAKLDTKMVKEEAAKIMKRNLIEQQNKKKLHEQALHDALEEKAKKKSNPPSQMKQKPSGQESVSPDKVMTPDPETIRFDTAEYFTGQTALFYQYEGEVKCFQIPCYVASGAENLEKSGKLDYSTCNTLYLEVVCPAIKPELVVISNDSNPNIDFGSISLGQNSVKSITIQNISDSLLNLSSNTLDPQGPFSLLNALRPLDMGATHTLVVSFSPTKGSVYQENLKIFTGNTCMNLRLNGIGIQPSVSLSLEGNSLDFGYSLAGEKLEKVFQMHNNSKLPVSFKISLDSANPLIVKENELKRCQHLNDLHFKPSIGPDNYGGNSPFDVTPVEGILQSGAKKDITLTFYPDHQSELYADLMRISLSSTDDTTRNIQLFGKSRTHTMYVRGVEPLSNIYNNESLVLNDLETNPNAPPVATPSAKETEDTSTKVPIPMLLTLYSVASPKTIGEFTTAEKVIFFGCMKVNPNGPKKDLKKNGDFSFENTKEIAVKGFNVDLTKSAVEAGGERQVKISWKPQPGTDLTQTVHTSILITTKGDIVETWKLILKGRIISDDDFPSKSTGTVTASDVNVFSSSQLKSSTVMKQNQNTENAANTS